MLPLHPQKGVNPRLSCCMDCGKEVGVILLGVHDNVWTCKHCHKAHIQAGHPFECKGCGQRNPLEQWELRKVGEQERLPIELCDECKTKREAARVVVEERGGIYWRCSDCGAAGAIQPTAPLVALVRKQLGIPTGPCGVEFSREDCPCCGEQKGGSDE